MIIVLLDRHQKLKTNIELPALRYFTLETSFITSTRILPNN
jgi:hypothetical protein